MRGYESLLKDVEPPVELLAGDDERGGRDSARDVAVPRGAHPRGLSLRWGERRPSSDHSRTRVYARRSLREAATSVVSVTRAPLVRGVRAGRLGRSTVAR